MLYILTIHSRLCTVREQPGAGQNIVERAEMIQYRASAMLSSSNGLL